MQPTREARPARHRPAALSQPGRRPGASNTHWLFFALPVALLLFAGALRADTDTLLQSQFWDNITTSPLTRFLKDNLWAVYGAIAVTFLVALNAARRARPAFSLEPVLFAILLGYCIVRAAMEDQELAGKVLFLLVLFSSFQIYFGYLFGSYRNRANDFIRSGFLLASYGLIFLNLFEYVSGNGYAGNLARFFGTSGHPNFLGVQMGICALVVLSQFEMGSKISKTINAIAFGACMLILYESGSRTGILVFAVGAFVYFSLSRRISTNLAILLLGLVGISVFFAFGVFEKIVNLDVYTRGSDANTRSVPWEYLWRSVVDAPFFGHGEKPKFSEQSWLRGWSIYGIIFPLVLAFITISSTYRILMCHDRNILRRIAPFAAVFFGLVAGSMFEGFLVDVVSFPIFAWLLSLTAMGISLGLPQPAGHGRPQVPVHRRQPSPRRAPPLDTVPLRRMQRPQRP